MARKILDRDGDAIEVNSGRKFVYLDMEDSNGQNGQYRALTIDQCAALIAALTDAAKEIGR
jgi:hypothetical protein